MPALAVFPIRYRSMNEESIIDAVGYLAIWREQGATSIPERPRDPCFRRYLGTLRTFVSGSVYPVWWTSRDRSRFLHHLDPEATPISFQELLAFPALCDDILAQRAALRTRDRARPHLIVEHCNATGVRVVKDGCKELLALLLAGTDSRLEITEVSGWDWSSSMLDMRRILAYHGLAVDRRISCSALP